MEFAIYRFRFPVGVHFGAGALWDGMNTLPADAFFSALCQEALALEGAAGIGALVSAVREGAFRLSDLFPFVGDELYLPKPLYPVSSEQEGDSIVKKSFKKLKYIPVSQWEAYLRGELDPVAEAEKFQRLGTYTLRSMAASRAPEKLESGDTLPYSVGVYQFLTGNGLYLIAGFGERGIQERFETLLRSLSYRKVYRGAHRPPRGSGPETGRLENALYHAFRLYGRAGRAGSGCGRRAVPVDEAFRLCRVGDLRPGAAEEKGFLFLLRGFLFSKAFSRRYI